MNRNQENAYDNGSHQLGRAIPEVSACPEEYLDEDIEYFLKQQQCFNFQQPPFQFDEL